MNEQEQLLELIKQVMPRPAIYDTPDEVVDEIWRNIDQVEEDMTQPQAVTKPTTQEDSLILKSQVREAIEREYIKKGATFVQFNDGVTLDWEEIRGYNVALERLLKKLGLEEK